MSNDVAKKGRDKGLIISRNKKLCARFYYYSILIGLRFEKCLQKLNEEFDLSESRISDIIAENTTQLTDLEVNATTGKELKKTYPFLNLNLSL